MEIRWSGGEEGGAFEGVQVDFYGASFSPRNDRFAFRIFLSDL